MLAVVAAPKFIDIQDDAHNEVTRSTMASFKSGVEMLRMKWQIKGKPSELMINGTLVKFTNQGWAEKPSDDAAGCIALWQTVLNNAPKIEPFSRTAVISDWSALYLLQFNVNECFFYKNHGVVWNNATTDRFSYYPVAVGSNPPGTIIGWNLD